MTRDQRAWPPGFSQHGKSNKCQLENSSSIEPHHIFKATSRKFQGNVWTRAFMIRRNGPVGPGVMEYCRAACKSALLAYWMAVKVWPTGSCSQFQVGDLREMSRFLEERPESAERSLMVEQLCDLFCERMLGEVTVSMDQKKKRELTSKGNSKRR